MPPTPTPAGEDKTPTPMLLLASCVVFKGYRQDSGTGYGERTVKGKRWLAHRYEYFLKHGPIPAGLLVCHRCNNKGCINTDHLYLATNHQNILDAKRDGLLVNPQTHKKNCSKCGSDYSFNKYGRYCKPCKNRSNVRTKRLRALSAASQPSAMMGGQG